ncbi:Oligoendopeptidase F, plasmid [Acetobacteraceae bacterium EV16G]|uniref:Oligoendopeptidase F, plasmid n=3 Tax=Sorlinia euscelidii TaxID=3081148 RepID=A0ABU7U357_9PROT
MTDMMTPADKQQMLPRWDLSDLYAGLDDPAIARDIESCAAEARAFATRYKGQVAQLSGAALADAIEAYQTCDERMGRLHAYAQLRFATEATSPEVSRFSQMIQERLNKIASDMMFFTLEINRMADDRLEACLTDVSLNLWAPFLRAVRLTRPYQLADDVEKVLLEKDVTGRAAWVRLFDETQAAMTVSLDGAVKPLGEALNRLSDPDRARREDAADAVHTTLTRHQHVLTMVTNVLSKDKAIEDQLRGYERPDSSRHLANFIAPEIVDTLVETVTRNYENLSHRYYRLKAGWLGLDSLSHWDRNAPLTQDETAQISWPEARQIVTEAYQDFDPVLGDMARDFLDRNWIDAAPYPGKSAGAFAHPVTPAVHPYLLLNYHGKVRDVMTLAHELGHGLHQILAGRQGYLQSATPLTLAETASVFGEMLVFRRLVAHEKDKLRRRHMIAAKIEDMLNTVVRQVAFYKFEREVHAARQNGELSAAQLGEIWLKTQRDSLGPAITLDERYSPYWSYVPHFIHAPFYVYAYAFGDCLVNALYQLYQQGHPDFTRKYRALLEAGGTQSHKELLAPFGIDLTDPTFWQKGLDVISGLIDALEDEALEERQPAA